MSIARPCARCGTIQYVSLEDTTAAGSLCETCRTGSPPAVLPGRLRDLFFRAEARTAPPVADAPSHSTSAPAPGFDAASNPTDEPEGSSGSGDSVPTDESEPSTSFEIIRARAVAPTFTGAKRSLNLRVIIPILVVMLAAALGLGSFLVRERASIPDTPAGQRLEWLLEAMNDSSIATQPVVREIFSASVVEEVGAFALVGEIRAWDLRHNEYRLARIVDGGRHRLVVLITTESMEWGELTLEVEPDEPHEILRFTIGPAEPPR